MPKLVDDIPLETVVATVDGKPVTAGDIKNAMAVMPPDWVGMFNQNPQAVVQQIFVMRHLAGEAEKVKLAEQSPYKEQIALDRANRLAAGMLSYEQDHFNVTQEMVNDVYAKNPQKYQETKIKGILVAFKPALVGEAGNQSLEDIAKAALKGVNVQRSEGDAKARAEAAVRRARAGEDFVKLVQEFSDDAETKAKDGDAPSITAYSAQSDQLKKIAGDLPVGQVSDPIRQPDGYYIIKAVDRSIQPVNMVFGVIVSEVKKQHLNDWFAGVMSRFEPKVENMQFFAQPGKVVPLPQAAPAAPGAPAR